jgi:hypothetical protein
LTYTNFSAQPLLKNQSGNGATPTDVAGQFPRLLLKIAPSGKAVNNHGNLPTFISSINQRLKLIIQNFKLSEFLVQVPFFQKYPI